MGFNKLINEVAPPPTPPRAVSFFIEKSGSLIFSFEFEAVVGALFCAVPLQYCWLNYFQGKMKQPCPTPPEPKTGSMSVGEADNIKEIIPPSSLQNWEQVCTDNIDNLKESWHDT